MGNIFSELPDDLDEEVFECLADSEQVTIERIISRGQTSPDEGWYDQDRNEWVIVLRGTARVAFDAAPTVTLTAGDYVNIPAHTRHKVIFTSREPATLWLAVHYR